MFDLKKYLILIHQLLKSDNMISIEMQPSCIGVAEEITIYHYDKCLYDIYGAR